MNEKARMKVYVCGTLEEMAALIDDSEPLSTKREALLKMQYAVEMRFDRIPSFTVRGFHELIPHWARERQKQWLSGNVEKKFQPSDKREYTFVLDKLEVALKTELGHCDACIPGHLMDLADVCSRCWVVPPLLHRIPEGKEINAEDPHEPSQRELTILSKYIHMYMDLDSIKTGDTVYFSDYVLMRNCGVAVWDGTQLVPLVHTHDEYGHLPPAITINTYPRADYFSSTISHNRYVHFDPTDFQLGEQVAVPDSKVVYAPIINTMNLSVDKWYLVSDSAETHEQDRAAFKNHTLYEYITVELSTLTVPFPDNRALRRVTS